MRGLRDRCLALFRPQNVKWIAFGNVIILVMMIKVLTFSSNTKYMGVVSSGSRSNYSAEQLVKLQKELQIAAENGDKVKGINLWKQLMAGNEWFSLRLPPMMENGDEVLQFFRPPGTAKSKSKSEEKHCDLCVGGKPKTPISSRAFLHMYKRQCESRSVNTAGVITTLPICNCLPKAFVGRQSINISHRNEGPNKQKDKDIRPGGYWKPSDCYARDRVAIVIPFRDRQSHLNILLKYLHPLLQRQQIEYRIFVVEQQSPKIFNKASLMNAGFHEARKLFNFDCVVFHDVDMIPEDDRNFYTCMNSPRHVGAYLDKYKYRLLYKNLVGGAILFKPEEFHSVNGFSNRYYGWGGEDDDMSRRLLFYQMTLYRYSSTVARYSMIKHKSDRGNPRNKKRYALLDKSKVAYKDDGLNNVAYSVGTLKMLPLYTWIKVILK